MKQTLYTFFDGMAPSDNHAELTIFNDDDAPSAEIIFYGEDAEGSILTDADNLRTFAKFLIESLDEFEAGNG